VVRALGAVSLPAGACLADALFSRTRRRAPRAEEAAFLARATAGTIQVRGERIRTWRWPGRGPRILLAHGWGSHAGRFAVLAEAALTAGAEVIAFDAPGHGESSGWRASMPEVACCLRAVADQAAPIHAVIGHSLGGAAALLAACQGLPVSRLITVAAPARVTEWLDQFRDLLDLPDPLDHALRQRLLRRLRVTEAELDLPSRVGQLRTPALVVHDADDTEVGVAAALALTAGWPSATLVRTTGLGHHAILRDPAVIDRVVAFALAAPPGRTDDQNGL
jgi:pimeloyl-ACP methyl ester carboxylesterase